MSKLTSAELVELGVPHAHICADQLAQILGTDQRLALSLYAEYDCPPPEWVNRDDTWHCV